MNLLFKQLRSILLSLLVLVAIFPIKETYAQWGGSQGSGIPGTTGMRRGAGRNASNPDSSSATTNSHLTMLAPDSHLLTYEQIETRLSQLEEALKLKPEQTKAWSNFAMKVRLYASDVAKERVRLNSDNTSNNLDGIKYLSQASDDAKSRYTTLKEIEETAKPLYKTLTAEQKPIFDSKVPTFIASTPKRLGSNQPNYNLPDLGSSPAPSQSSGSSSLPGYIHQ
jgi:LTXXQ motif family protein